VSFYETIAAKMFGSEYKVNVIDFFLLLLFFVAVKMWIPDLALLAESILRSAGGRRRRSAASVEALRPRPALRPPLCFFLRLRRMTHKL